MQKFLVSLFLLFLFSAQFLDAQRRGVTYQDLLVRSDQPGIHVDHQVLPAADGGSLFAVAFRMDYDLLPFRRIRANETSPEPGFEFTAQARMNLDVYRSGNRQREFSSLISSSWADTAWASSYEETRSRHKHLEGFMSTSLDPGEYRFMLQLNRGETTRENRSRELTFTVPNPDASDENRGRLLLVESVTEQDAQVEFKWMNYGNFILYGQDFTLLLVLPEQTDPDTEYITRIHRLEPGSERTTMGDPLFEETLTASEMVRTRGFAHSENRKIPVMTFEKSDTGSFVSLLEIPNRQYPNSRLRITVTKAGEEEPALSRNVDSRWIDMPVSLYNMDVAIRMLRFIVDDSTLRELNRGSAAERERRFREFWAERDPTPDTEYNELMAEYYRRIDHAYQQFTTPERPGFESDQGRAYIQMGPPNRTERTFPTNGPTREIWVYNNQTLIFEATSGFGDFRLVGRE